MFSRVLIANRGEIALRLIRTCRELGIETIAAYSEADADALYLNYADEKICIGPGKGANSYLNIPSIISAAEISDVEAIHPGYGFLAENSHFAEVCQSCNIEFIGPSPQSMDLMGDKMQARRIARQCGIPISPGSDGVVQGPQDALAIAHSIGYPVIVKAAAGGGGRGMRIAHNDASLTNAVMAARNEAEASFNNAAIYMERYLEKCRHIEIQIMADKHGNIVHLGERDCSIQRRHQKLIEEAPSIAIDEDLRNRMGEDAKKLAKAAQYHNVGTVEFLLEDDGNYYFIEMNTRIQVEHPVTEMITGMDLIKEQFRIAAGQKLPLSQQEVKIHGHAIECRINAENPSKNFQPCPGAITLYKEPGGAHVRVDSHVYGGYNIPPHYDSMLAKLIAWGSSRSETIAIMRNALQEYVIHGVDTTIPLYLEIFGHHRYILGKLDTNFIEDYFE